MSCAGALVGGAARSKWACWNGRLHARHMARLWQEPNPRTLVPWLSWLLFVDRAMLSCSVCAEQAQTVLLIPELAWVPVKRGKPDGECALYTPALSRTAAYACDTGGECVPTSLQQPVCERMDVQPRAACMCAASFRALQSESHHEVDTNTRVVVETGSAGFLPASSSPALHRILPCTCKHARLRACTKSGGCSSILLLFQACKPLWQFRAILSQSFRHSPKPCLTAGETQHRLLHLQCTPALQPHAWPQPTLLSLSSTYSRLLRPKRMTSRSSSSTYLRRAQQGPT